MEIFENRGKHEKAGVAYQEYASTSKTCSECANFTYPNTCAIVKGKINPDGTCDLFTPGVDKRASFMRGFANGLKV